MKQELKIKFKEIFQEESSHLFFSPGRINLIGEHTDYNGGYVFPCAITFGTYGVLKLRKDRTLRFFSENFASLGIIESHLDHLEYKKEDDWVNYCKGVLDVMIKKGYNISQGFDLYIYGNIPHGSGLSSSASLEVLIGTICKVLFSLDLTMIDIALIAQKAENEYIGVNCGIMDQFVIAMGKAHHAIALNTQTLDYIYSPIDLKNYVILIMNTNKERKLADSKYNERRNECEIALKQLQALTPIQQLCELTVEEFTKFSHVINDPVILKRAKHAIYENERVKKAMEVLQQGDLVAFGQYMNQSHQSLKEDYEVTGLELDTLVEVAIQQPGVLGARMTGAGFGGCAIALVEEAKVEKIQQVILQEYMQIVGYPCSFYIASIGQGAGQYL